MKNLILCSFLLLFVGFIYSQESVKVEEIGLEVMTKDLGKMDWVSAKKACTDLGNGWRLPMLFELKQMYEYKDEIGGFVNAGYWSNEIDDSIKNGSNAWIFWMDYGFADGVDMGRTGYVRAVRDLK